MVNQLLMKTTCFILLMVCCTALQLHAQSSYGRREAEKDIEKKYENDRQKGVKAVDERLDKWEESDRAKRAGIEAFPTMSMSVSIEYPEKPKNNVTIDYFFRDYDCAAIFKTGKDNNGMDRMIMNYREGNTTMLMTDKKGRKTGMVIDMKMYDGALKHTVEKQSNMLANGDAEIKRTDETKIIEGYTCRKFLFEDQQNTTALWVSRDVAIDYIRFNQAAAGALANSKNPNFDIYRKAGIDGIVIQTHIIPKNGRQDEAIITTKNIRANHAPAEMFSTAGYEISTMPGMKDLWKAASQEK